MRTTLVLDDELVAEAQTLSGLTEKPAMVREALRAIIQRESARRLAVWPRRWIRRRLPASAVSVNTRAFLWTRNRKLEAAAAKVAVPRHVTS
jgi:Arc/MetJ family transcription regulator